MLSHSGCGLKACPEEKGTVFRGENGHFEDKEGGKMRPYKSFFRVYAQSIVKSSTI